MSDMTYDEKFIARFWAKVDRSAGPDSCWPWTGYRNPAGYGQINVSHHRPRTASRVVYELTNGHIPHRMLICHACDNPACCNPNHLWSGTHKENSEDMVSKGRGRTPRGESNGKCKFSDGHIMEALALVRSGISSRKAAPMFGMSASYLRTLMRGDQRAKSLFQR
jgi:HNH endonuclease